MASVISPEAAEKLERALKKFKATPIYDITDVYDYHPNYLLAKLGSGSYGDAFRMKSKSNPNEPLRVAKIIPKIRVTRNVLQVQHICAEIAVTTLLHDEYCNHAVDIYHSADYLYIVLELCEAPQADPRTRLYHLFARYHTARLAEVEEMIASWEAELKTASLPVMDRHSFFDDKIHSVINEYGYGRWREAPRGTDLFNYIVFNKKLPDQKSAIILKQALRGCDFLHTNQVVHRDIKTENLVLEEYRSAEPIRGESDNNVIGTRIRETIKCKLIDFNLVKYLRMAHWPSSPSPEQFATSTMPFGDDVPANAFGDDDSAAAAASNFGTVSVTPCGTELYCALEVITGILQSGFGRTKWISDAEALPKLDLYGCGTMLFCMANGRPPFRPPPSARGHQTTREEKMRYFAQMIESGPLFSPGVSDQVKQLCLRLMHNDPKLRPSAGEALRDKFFEGVGNTVTYDVMCDGSRSALRIENVHIPERAISGLSPILMPPPSDGDLADTEDASPDSGAENIEDADLIMAAMRGKEDNGDHAGKESIQVE